MSSELEPAGFLMFGSWAAELVLAHTFEFAGGSAAPGLARAQIAELLAGRVGEEDMLDVAVLTSELVTNAVRHGDAGPDDTIVVHVAIAADVLRLEVCDHARASRGPTSCARDRRGAATA